MAAPWSVLFSAIPWSDVIAHAPTVAKGAKKLWQKVGKRPAAADAPARSMLTLLSLMIRRPPSADRTRALASGTSAFGSQGAVGWLFLRTDAPPKPAVPEDDEPNRPNK